MIVATLDGKAYAATLIDKRQIEEGQLLSFATSDVRNLIRRAELGKPRQVWEEPVNVNWTLQLRSAVTVTGHPVVRPGRMTLWRDEQGRQYATGNLAVLWTEIDPATLHCECPLGGEPCCTCGASDLPGCPVPATMAVRHQTEMALQGR